MYCRANQLPAARSAIQKRVEAALAPHAHLIRCFDLTAPADQADFYLTVSWNDRQRADTIIPLEDETSLKFEAELIARLAP